MPWSKLPEPVRKGIKGTAIAAGATPVATGLALMAAAKVRGDKIRLDKPFPHLAPQQNRVGESETTVYTYGGDVYTAMLKAIKEAKDQILFESFIWKADEVGERFKSALNAAAQRGVEVFIIYDGFGNTVVPNSFYDFDPRIHVLRFRFAKPNSLFAPIRTSGADHRKIIVVDDQIGFVGGYNIGSLYETKWRDTHLRVVGPGASELRLAFATFWNRWRTANLPELPNRGNENWLAHFRASRNSPAEVVFPIRRLYLDAIERATKHVYITSAYFIPDRDFARALLAACERGVDVKVIIPQHSNHIIADWLARGHYDYLLKGGVGIYLYRGAMIHAKTATVDGQWSTIGTANVDRLSFTGNYEINIEIFDRGVARTMERIFDVDLSNCVELTLADWQKRSNWHRIGEIAIAPLYPFG